jgi:membrane protein required for colicin V production
MTIEGLTWTDAVVLFLIASTAIFGAFRGAVRPVVSMAGLIVGVLLAGHIGPSLHAERLPWVAAQDDPILLGMAISWLLVILASLMAGGLVGRVLERVVVKADYGFADRLVGFGLGASKGALVGVLLCVGLLMLTPPGPVESDARSSHTLRGARWLVERARMVIPESALGPIENAIHGPQFGLPSRDGQAGVSGGDSAQLAR